MNFASPERSDSARTLLGGKRRMLATASIAMLGLALAQPAFAQEKKEDNSAPGAPEADRTAKEETTTTLPLGNKPGPTQAGSGGGTGADIVVTGSRIVRRDYTATSPTVTVDSTFLENSSSVNLEANLNRLPQFSPAQTQFITQDIQSSATNTVGASTVSLRQLGANRSLVLIDGRRGVPVNGSGTIDINSIPSAAIARVETITGGASSTYGADAVGGVVNFILKKNYQGLDLDAQASVNETGDGFEWRVAGITGANFDDGRGNVIFGMEHYDRSATYRSNIAAYSKYWADPRYTGDAFFLPINYTSNVTGGAAFPVTQVRNSFGALNGGTGATNAFGQTVSQAGNDAYGFTQFNRTGRTLSSLIGNGQNLLFNPDGTLFVNTSVGGGRDGDNPNTTVVEVPACATPGAATCTADDGPYQSLLLNYRGPLDGLTYKVTRAGTLTRTNTEAPASSGLKRWSFFAKGHYDFDENVSLFTQATFSKTSVQSISEIAPAIGGWGTNVPHGTAIYTGNATYNIPNSVRPDGFTNENYVSAGRVIRAAAPGVAAIIGTGRFGLNCASVTGGCTNSEVFPTPNQLSGLLGNRVFARQGNESDAAYDARFAAAGCTGLPAGVARPAAGVTDPTTAATGLGSGNNCPFTINQYLTSLGPRQTQNDNTSFQLVAGLEGRIPGTDWTWEVFGSHGESVAKTLLLNFASVERTRLVTLNPNYGVGLNATGNSNPSQPGGGFQGAIATCTSGLQPFNPTANVSEDCKSAIRVDGQTQNIVRQTQWQANLQGGLFELPYGDLRFAAGAEYRSLSIRNRGDSSASAGRTFLDGIIGIFPQGNTRGTDVVRELYGELLVPVLADLPFAKNLSLELGYRYSDYRQTGGNTTYKINGEYAPVRFLTFRGGYQRSARAPNLAELFTAGTSTLTGGGGDPCNPVNSTATTASPPFGNFSANPALNPNAAKVRAICEQQMGPVAATYYANTTTYAATGSYTGITAGNSTGLEPEKGTTYTIGGVLQSPIRNPWLSQLRLSVDYYNVKITGAISLQSIDGILRRCYSTVYNTNLDPTAQACQLISRDPTNGAILNVGVTYTNAGAIETSGVDVQADWGLTFKDAGIGIPGRMGLNVLVNYVDKFATTADTTVQPLRDDAGTGRAPFAGASGPTPRWKSYTTLSYSAGGANLSLSWQHIPKVGPNLVDRTSDADLSILDTPAYNLFNLSGGYAITRDISIRFGVDNLLNKIPPFSNYESEGDPNGGAPRVRGVSYGNLYNVLGRRFFLGAKARF